MNTESIIDMRSDTVTKPTDDMREAMKHAVVGDDVFGDDPTVALLETKSAHMFGKEAALFVPSGTMGNLLCVLVHCSGRGEEFIVGEHAHIYTSEQGGASWIGGVHSFAVPNQPDGTIKLEDLESAIRVDDPHYPITKLICLENTHNRMGGRVLSIEYVEKVADLCAKYNLKLHLDGARIFNAATALGVHVSKLVKRVDSVSVCLSKGLGAPVGSVIAGTKDFIRQAGRLRKALGGGLRQAGVLAAPGIIALEKMSLKLQEDHNKAKKMAQVLAQLPGIEVDPVTVESNIIFLKVVKEGMTSKEFQDRLAEKKKCWSVIGEEA